MNTLVTLLFDNSILDSFVNWAGNASASGNTNINGGAGLASQGISQQLSDHGWTQTSDFGQVNWATIARMPVGTDMGTFTLNLTSVASAIGSSTVYTGTISSGGSNAYAGMTITVAGFANGANNGTFLCTASDTLTITLTNSGGIAETLSATASGTHSVYEIWKFTDTNAAACPVFLRMEYGSSTTSQPGLAFVLGTGSDGNGNITGHVGAREVPNTSNESAGGTITEYTCRFYSNNSGGAGPSATLTRFVMALWIDLPAQFGTVTLTVERSHDNTGADTALYYTYIQSAYSSPWQSSIFAPGSAFGTVGNRENGVFCISGLPATTSYAFGTSAPLLFAFPNVGWVGNPITSVVPVRAGDATNGATFTANDAYGTSHTYVTMKSSAYAVAAFGNINNLNALCMLWE